MSACFVADIGKSATRGEVRTGTRRFAGQAGGLSPDTASDPAGPALVADAVRAAFDAALSAAGVDAAPSITRVGVSTTVFPSDPAGRTAIAAAITAHWPDASVAVAEDVVCAHAGAVAGTGIVIVAGTGAVVAGLGVDGTWLRADGWGPLLGDRGGAFAIGRAGLRAAFRAVDRNEPTTLRELAGKRLGGLDLGVAQRLLARSDAVAEVAAFAADVSSAAADGDGEAGAVLRREVDALVSTTVAVSRRLGTPDVAVVGGLTADPLWSRLHDTAAREAGLVPGAPGGTILDGAVRILDDRRYGEQVVTTSGVTT